MADEYKIALEAVVDPSSTSLQTSIENLSKTLKPIELKINTSNVESKLKSIKTQIESLSKMTINLGQGRGRGSISNISKETAAYKDLLSIANQIDKLSLKIGGMKFNGGDIKQAEAQLKELSTTYNNLYEQLSKGNFGEGGFKGFKAGISDTKAKLIELDAQLTQTQTKMVTDIKSNIANGSLSVQIDELERKFNVLGIESQDVTNHISTLRTLLSSMDSSDDIESVVADYDVFKNTLTEATNKVKVLKAEQSTANTNLRLADARTALGNDIDVWLKNNSAAAKTFGARLQEIKAQIQSADATQLQHLKREFQDVTKQAQLAGVVGKTMGDQFKQSLKTVGSYFSAAMLITRAISVMRNMYNEVLKVDTAMTGLRRVTNLTGEQYQKMYSDMTKSAKKYGSTLEDIINSTASWVRLGFDAQTAEKLSEVSAMYQHVTDLDENTAVTNLVTAYKGYQEKLLELSGGDEVKAMTRIADVYDKLGNEMPVTAAQVGEGMTKAASVLEMAGASFEQAAGMITGGGAVTQNFDAFGNALRVSALRIRSMKGELEELGEEVDENISSVSKIQTQILNLTSGKVNIFEADGETFRNIYDIYADIADIYDELSDTDKASLLELLGGKQRANQIQGMIKRWSDVEKATEKAYEAEGTAAQENEKYMESMQGKINATKASWQALANTIISSDFLKGLIDSGEELLSTANGIVETFGTLPSILTVISGYLSASKNIGRVKMLILNNKMPIVVIVLFGYGQFRYYQC